MAAGVPLFVVDAFADAPFEGNPAAVCLLDGPRPAEWMQAVANELRLSETAFCQPAGDRFALRWFTPEAEVPLCGHATLATAHVLWGTGTVAGDAVCRFETASGLLQASPRADGAIELDLPADPVRPVDPPDELVEALGLSDGDVGFVGRGAAFLLLALDRSSRNGASDVSSGGGAGGGAAALIEALTPDFVALAGLWPDCVIVSAAGTGTGFDVVSRCFAPGIGIDEDPVTGSAHCTLAAHWGPLLGRTRLQCRQVSARGGTVEVTVDGDRVRLAGRAHTVVSGTLEA